MTTDLLPAPPVARALPQLSQRELLHRLPEETVQGLALVLSHYLARGTTASYFLSRLLRLYAHTAVKLDGVEYPAPVPGIPPAAPASNTPKTPDGLTSEAFKEAWADFVDEHGSDEPLPLDALVHFVEPELWAPLAALIVDGPQLAVARIERALRQERKRKVKTDRRHQAGQRGISASYMTAYLHAGNRLLQVLVELGARSVRLRDALLAWTRAARLTVALPTEEQTDTTAPRREQVRDAWQRIQAAVDRALAPGAGAGDELAAIAAMTDRQLRNGAFKALRLRLAFILLAVLGCRLGAIGDASTGGLPRLQRQDYKPDHRAPDGTVGPAIRIRPAKSKHSTVTSWKPLPEEVGRMVEAYIAAVERLLGRALRDEEPLLLANLKHARRWASRSIEHVFGGTTGQIRALIPLAGDPTHGHTAHTFRSFAAQTVRSLDGHDWLVRERVDASPHWVAEALLDHGLAGLDALYGGASKAPDRERLAAIGARLNWALVTTDAGARRDYDEAAFERALRAHQALTVELGRLGEAVDQAFASKPTPGGEDLVAALLARIEEMMRAHALVRQERQAFEQLVAVERELERLEFDPARKVIVPDAGDWDGVSLDELRQRVLGGAAAAAPAAAKRQARQREFISVQELRYIAGVAPATVPRWLGQGGRPPQLPFPDGDPRNPWPADRVPLDESRGPRHRRIIVAGLAESWLRADPGRKARLEEVLATSGPEGWAQEHLDAPLALPDWLR